ncbi:MAG: monovalent cation/H(+) antiporter subunit G [Methylacidiphilales bacterium]|nr:monovalent cation/H(+) antiporter subunit G [Candidatus Methylacidiphilales bacterium]MDW8349577.1 monovalent cation/H(+) antiporter subunit G [Verrucomicrobiae bacterium]
MRDLFVSILMTLGVIFMVIAALGILRFPDLFSRMHAASKASTLGISLVLLAFALSQPTPQTFIKAALAMLFIFLTTPVACHLLSRAVLRRQRTGTQTHNRLTPNKQPSNS